MRMGTFEEYMSPEEWKVWKNPPKKEREEMNWFRKKKELKLKRRKEHRDFLRKAHESLQESNRALWDIEREIAQTQKKRAEARHDAIILLPEILEVLKEIQEKLE